MTDFGKEGLMQILKSICISLLIILASILVFALINKFTAFNNRVIITVNQLIKSLSIFLGCFFGIKCSGGIVKGLIVGLLVVLLSFLIFGLMTNDFSISLSFLLDLLLGIVVGGISGIVAVNVHTC